MSQLRIICQSLTLIASLLASACNVTGDSCVDRDVTCNPSAGLLGLGARGTSARVNGPRYVSCADVQAQSPGAPDGDYLLTLPGGSVSVYCYNMAASPKEYLTFQNCNANGQPNANSSLYAYSATGNQNVTPGGLWTYYNRVRFNPTNLTIDQTDRTFSTNNGGDRWFGATHFSNNDYADAGSCGCDGTLGTANIDMTGLPFTVVQGQFAKGADPTSYMNYSPDNKIVNLGGGGCCGATNTLGNPIQLSW